MSTDNGNIFINRWFIPRNTQKADTPRRVCLLVISSPSFLRDKSERKSDVYQIHPRDLVTVMKTKMVRIESNVPSVMISPANS